MEPTYTLEKILDLTRFEDLQESLAHTLHFSLCLVDENGNPLTNYSGLKPFCHHVRNSTSFSHICEFSSKLCLKESFKRKEPIVYQCPFQLVDIIIPIMIEHHYVGALIAGEIKTEQTTKNMIRIHMDVKEKEMTQFLKTYQHEFEHYRTVSLQEVSQTIKMLEKISHYLIREAVQKDYYIRAYKHALQITKTLQKESSILKEEQVTEKIETYLKTRPEEIYQAKNKHLQPAIDAVYLHKGRHLSLEELSSIVSLTPTYLSRLLKEEYGIPFQKIYTRLKVDWSKSLLCQSTLSVKEISEALGYLDAGNFIKSFKKITGLTPHAYRQKNVLSS